MYRIAVCDDEPGCLEEIIDVSRSILRETGIEGCVKGFSSFTKLKSAMQMGLRFDLFLLDILVDGPEGLDFAKLLRSSGEEAGIVFISSSQAYLLGGYDVHAIQYILKPLSREKLTQSICYDYRRCVDADRRIRLSHRGTVLSFREHEVLYLESRNRRVNIYTDEGTQSLPGTLLEYELQLPAARFARAHTSFCINIRRVKKMTWGRLTLDNGESLPVSRKYYHTFKTAVLAFIKR